MWYPIRISEGMIDEGASRVFTGTDQNGMVSSNTCLDWTTTMNGVNADVGEQSGTSSVFTYFGTTGCSANLHFYCFGVDRAATVTAPTPPSSQRIAFVTAGGWTIAGGITSADTFCQGEANAAGLTGTFMAMLSPTNTTAGSRFTVQGGAPWVRVDGVQIAIASKMFVGPLWDSPINLTADGTTYYGNFGVLGGAANPNSIGASTTNCTNWTSGTGNNQTSGRAGFTQLTTAFAQDTGQNCAATYNKLYCLQQ